MLPYTFDQLREGGWSGHSDRMISYGAFGFRLDSDFELPELDGDRSLAAPAWRVTPGGPEHADWSRTLIGTESVYGPVQVRAYASPESFRLVFDDTGTFDVRVHDRTISWYRGEHATVEAMRADLLGRVIAVAAHRDGRVALHASAVCIDGRGIAFVGVKGAGKSTLALALVQRGATLVTDDTLVVSLDERGAPWAAPGLQRVRLWEDSARALGADASGSAGAKPTLNALPSIQRQQTDAPLVACYVIRPASGDAQAGRTALSAVHGAVTCVGFSKLGTLAGGNEGIAMLDRCSALARAIPIYAIDVPRDFARLDETAAALLAWHRAPDVPNVAARS